MATDGQDGTPVNGIYYASSAGGAGHGAIAAGYPNGQSGSGAGLSSYIYEDYEDILAGRAKATTPGSGGGAFLNEASGNVQTGANGIVIVKYYR
jgi:hypothetical protein